MKRKSLILIVAAIFAIVGNVTADTTKLLEADGWTKITTLPTSSEIASNYYVFVDNTRDLMLGTAKGVNQNTKWYSLGVYYQNSVEPTSADINGKTWTLESYGSNYAMRNLEYSVSPFQTEWQAAWKFDTNDVYATANEWCEVVLAYSIEDACWTIQNGKYPSSGYLGPWTDSNFTNGAECAANKSGDNVGKFQIYTISRTQFKQNLLDNASESNPVDLTPWYVTNATFDANNRTGWSEEGSGGNNNTSIGCEIWHRSGFRIYQNLTVPNGKYKVSLQMAGTSGAGSVYGTSGSDTETASSSATAGSDFQNTVLSMIQDRTFGQVMTGEVTVADGALQIGMSCATTDQWLVFDNFKLYCTGIDLSAYETQLSDLVDECNDFIDSDVVPTACETAISSAISTYNDTYETAKEYSTAILALTAVLNTYRNDAALQSAYAAYYALKTNVEGLMTGVADGDTKTTLTSAISTATSSVEAATTVAAINTQKTAIRSAAMTFISGTDGQFDITFLASQQCSDWKKKNGSAADEVTWAVTNRGDWSFAESYESTCTTTGTVLYQTVSDLPAGYYQVGMYAMAAYTSGRGFASEATEGDANRSFAFAGNLDDDSSILRTGIPIPFKTSFDFSELTTLDVNVHLSSTGNLTFGVQKDLNGSNWHFAQIASIIYSNSPDLTALQATRDALVAEAEGILSASAEYLTSAQQTDLQDAIGDGNDADTFDDLNTATLTTLPNAIYAARQQVTIVKANRVLMIAALERFESSYNLADGTDYRKVTMSAGAWTDLLSAVDDVTKALDDVEQADRYATLKNALVAKMDATDASLRLFKSYKAMVDGCTALSIGGTTTAADDSNMATDAAQTAAIAALNTAFTTHVNAQTSNVDAAVFLGGNLDFSAAEGTAIKTDNGNGIYNVDGWDVEYADADQWAAIQTNQKDNGEKLYMRNNWSAQYPTLLVSKQKMLPVGKYRLTLSWNSTKANMTNKSAYVIDGVSTEIGEATDGERTLTYDFSVTGSAKPFDLVIGFKRTGTGNAPAQIVVDDITLTALCPNVQLIEASGEATNAAEFDATDFPEASGVALTPSNANQIIYANAGQLTNTDNVVISGTCASLVVTDNVDISTTQEFSATAATYTRTMAAATQYGTLILPFPIDVTASDVDFFTLRSTNTGDGGLMRFVPETGTENVIPAGTPLLFKKKTSSATSVTITGAGTVPVIGESVSAVQGDDEWTATGYYQGNSALSGENVYYIAGDKFWYADGNDLNMKPFRAVFVAPNGIAGARSFVIGIMDDGPTGVTSLQADAVQDAEEVYTISGKRLGVRGRSALPKGIYIIGGKKIVVQ